MIQLRGTTQAEAFRTIAPRPLTPRSDFVSELVRHGLNWKGAQLDATGGMVMGLGPDGVTPVPQPAPPVSFTFQPDAAGFYTFANSYVGSMAELLETDGYGSNAISDGDIIRAVQIRLAGVAFNPNKSEQLLLAEAGIQPPTNAPNVRGIFAERAAARIGTGGADPGSATVYLPPPGHGAGSASAADLAAQPTLAAVHGAGGPVFLDANTVASGGARRVTTPMPTVQLAGGAAANRGFSPGSGPAATPTATASGAASAMRAATGAEAGAGAGSGFLRQYWPVLAAAGGLFLLSRRG